MENTLKPGDQVKFDLEGSSKSPYGYGLVTRVYQGTAIIQPNYELVGNPKMINIEKVG